MPNTSPPELMQLLLSTTLKGNTNTFLNFQERFQSLIDQSPSLLHSVGKDGYFVAFFFGAFASFLDAGLANIDPSTQVQNIFFRFDKHNNLKLAVLVHEESLHKLLCMTVSETNQTLTFDDDELKNIDWQIATTNRATRLRYEVIAYNLAIDKKTYKALLHEVEKPKLKLNSNQGTKPFTRIVSLKPNLEQSIRELSDSDNINQAMNQVLEHIVKTYKHYSNENSAVTKFFENEARDHGYVAGVFTNFKYRQHLKLYSEIFEGKGQADLVLLVRGHTKSSNSIPVIIEMKAGTSDNSQIAVGQAKAYVKGRFYNFIRILTTNKQVLCVGLNLHFSHNTNYSFYATSCIEREGNSIIEKFLSDSRRNPLNTQIIREQLEYLYYGIVWSNGGNSNDRYMSRFILGQSVFIPDAGSHKCIFFYSENEKMQEGTIQRPRDSEKKMKDHVTTIILIDGSKAFILNINELQAGLKSKNHLIPIEQINKEVNIIYEISCNLVGAPNNSNPFHRYCADGAITVTKHNSLDKYRDIKERAFDGTIKPLNNNIEFQNAFNTAKNSGQCNDYKKVFKVVAELLAPFKENIANEGEFQAVLHGLFSSYIAEDVRVFTEFQVGSGGETRGVGKEGKKGKLDMVLVVYSNPPVGIELKFATTEESLKQKVKEAEKDLEAYAQATAYKIITDTEQVKLMYAVFNASAQNAASLIKVSENFKDALVSHSSEAMMRLTSNAPQSTTQNRGR